MANNNNDGVANRGRLLAQERDKKLQEALKSYSSEQTRQAVGRLLEEFIDDSGKNYYAPDNSKNTTLYFADDDYIKEVEKVKNEEKVRENNNEEKKNSVVGWFEKRGEQLKSQANSKDEKQSSNTALENNDTQKEHDESIEDKVPINNENNKSEIDSKEVTDDVKVSLNNDDVSDKENNNENNSEYTENIINTSEHKGNEEGFEMPSPDEIEGKDDKVFKKENPFSYRSATPIRNKDENPFSYSSAKPIRRDKGTEENKTETNNPFSYHSAKPIRKSENNTESAYSYTSNDTIDMHTQADSMKDNSENALNNEESNEVPSSQSEPTIFASGPIITNEMLKKESPENNITGEEEEVKKYDDDLENDNLDALDDEDDDVTPRRRKPKKSTFASFISKNNSDDEDDDDDFSYGDDEDDDREESEEFDDDNSKGYFKGLPMPTKKIFVIGIFVIAVCIIAVLAALCYSYKNRLDSALQQISNLSQNQTNTEASVEVESLRTQVTELSAELTKLKSESVNQNQGNVDAVEPSTTKLQIADSEEPSTESDEDTEETTTSKKKRSSSDSTYTVKEGDTGWAICNEVYGEYSDELWEKVLQANGMTINDYFSPGDEFIIPKVD